MASPVPDVGLVLAGGGARAAYQVGALSAIARMVAPGSTPFRVVTGVSAGAINAAAIAGGAEDFVRAVEALRASWAAISLQSVFRTDPLSFARIGTAWLRDLSGLFGGGRANHLLDTAPLEKIVAGLGIERIPEAIASGRLRGVSVTATDYRAGVAVSWYDGAPEIEDWSRSTRVSARTRITPAHVLASAAIPVFFPPVAVDGGWFGDGCVRLTAPLSPAIHLGADRLLAIGVRHPRSGSEARALTTRRRAAPPLTIAEIAGELLDAVFLDSLEPDLERLARINGTLAAVPDRRRHELPQPLRPIPALALLPSKDLGALAASEIKRFPLSLRHLLRGLGADEETGWELLSYLAFEPAYVEALLALGERDTLARSREIAHLLVGASEPLETRRHAS